MRYFSLVLAFVCIAGCATRADRWQLRQVTHDAASHHNLSAQGKAFSPDGQWLCYDRNIGAIRDSSLICRVNVVTGEDEVAYDAASVPELGPGIAAASYLPDRDAIIFIHGPAKATGLRYEQFRRFGAIVRPGADGIQYADARDVTPPYTPGALRGGTHVHDPGGPGNEWIGFTYNDMIMKELEDRTGETRNLRTIGVTRLGIPVHVDKDAENWDGLGFSVVLVPVVPKPAPGSDQISRAEGDGWIGAQGYVRDGRRRFGRAFVGTLAEGKRDVFIVDIPEDITVPGALGPLEGTDSAFPAPPAGTEIRRLTRLGTVNGYVRANSQGTWLAFLAGDTHGLNQLFVITPSGEGLAQVTALPDGVGTDPCWHPSGRWLAVGDNKMLYRVVVGKSKDSPTPRPLLSKALLPGNLKGLSFAPDGARLAFNMDTGGQQQIFVLERRALQANR